MLPLLKPSDYTYYGVYLLCLDIFQFGCLRDKKNQLNGGVKNAYVRYGYKQKKWCFIHTIHVTQAIFFVDTHKKKHIYNSL